MLTIRLQRAGKKNKADFRIVLAEKTAASQKKFTEVLGSYNPHTKALVIRDQERLNYWVNEQHVEISATVNNLLVSKELIKGDKKKSFTIPKKEVVAEEAPAAESEPAAETTADVGEATPEEVAAEAEVPAETPVVAPAETATEESPAEAPAEEPKEEAQA